MQLKIFFFDNWKFFFNLNWIYLHKIFVTMYSIPYTQVCGDFSMRKYLHFVCIHSSGDRFSAKGPFFSENSMVLKKICQITILNLNFLNYILFVFVLQLIFRLTPLTSVTKKAKKFKRQVYLR